MYKPDLPPEYNTQRLERYIAQASNPTMAHLSNWLGEETEIKGCADARNMLFTMTFTHARLGTLGQVDLVFESDRALPGKVETRVYSGGWGAPAAPEELDERRAIMRKINKKAVRQFILKSRWSIFYYSGEELLESWTVIEVSITRVKSMAYHRSPPGTDMIKLVPPKGQGRTLIRTAKKQWVHEG
ncbi:MAG: hypothetical protein LBL26_10950 [Peptococcaceae bacterium]|nr:hypothetical protein [Peptococcaceae bacterium]